MGSLLSFYFQAVRDNKQSRLQRSPQKAEAAISKRRMRNGGDTGADAPTQFMPSDPHHRQIISFGHVAAVVTLKSELLMV